MDNYNIFFTTDNLKILNIRFENINKRNIHVVSEISEVTINKCYKKLEKIKEDLIPSQILKKYIDIK